jgi:hypothetical protein
MYRLIRSVAPARLLREQLPSLGGALLMAELFYKFGSFALECLAFLATWLVLDAAVQCLRRWLSRPVESTK